MQWIYTFEQGSKALIAHLGGKGANLSEMVNHGLADVTPPGFVITTDACNAYLAAGHNFPPGLAQQIEQAIQHLEQQTGRSFGGHNDQVPLLVSVRSGAPVSMPGMLETILNVGLSPQSAKALASWLEKPGIVDDLFLRLIRMFARTVYHRALDETCASVETCLSSFRAATGEAFPVDPYTQLHKAVAAVFDSWLAPNAANYRKRYQVADDLGTGVVVQAMVFGNLPDTSGTGVVFSRNPATGDRALFGEYLPRAQGEDLVSGDRTPRPIHELADMLPDVYDQLADVVEQLETMNRDVQDIEFTIENGKLWILQTRSAKRTPFAAIKTAHDMVQEGLIARADAIRRIDPARLQDALSPILEDADPAAAVASGTASSPGAAVGRIAFDKERVKQLAGMGEPVIFVQEKITPDDAATMPLVAGILTREGGATSHAAVVARGIGKPCIVGCSSLTIDMADHCLRIGDVTFSQGSYLSMDGTTGKIYAGKKKLLSLGIDEFDELRAILTWAGDIAAPDVQVNAHTPAEMEAVGQFAGHVSAIGLCKTERLFYDWPFRDVTRRALLAESETDHQAALDDLQRLHAGEWAAMLTQADPYPVFVRLLSVPLEHFLPNPSRVRTELAELKISQDWNETIGRKEQLLSQLTAEQHINPRYGARGMRLLLTRPAWLAVQVAALFHGTIQAADQTRQRPVANIILPNVSAASEVSAALTRLARIARAVEDETGEAVDYTVGVLIETPRAALTANEIAPLVDFVLLGTDGLTESVFAYAREDGAKFIPLYQSQDIFADPMRSFDTSGVGALFTLAVDRIRQARPDLPVGVVGAHVLDRDLIRWCVDHDLASVSVELPHVLRARLALAQTALNKQQSIIGVST